MSVARGGRSTCLAIRAAPTCPSTTPCWSIPPSTTCWSATSRAPPTWPMAIARASRKVGVALATSGPGATNLVTGIATALMDSSPTVFITGQVTSKLIGYDAFQEVDVTGITLPITKHNYLVTSTQETDPRHPRGLLHRPLRPPRPGADRYSQGRPADRHRLGIRRLAHPAARLPPRPPPAAGAHAARRRADQSRQTAGHPGRAGRLPQRGHGTSCANLPS